MMISNFRIFVPRIAKISGYVLSVNAAFRFIFQSKGGGGGGSVQMYH